MEETNDLIFDYILGEWRLVDKERIIEKTVEIRGGGAVNSANGQNEDVLTNDQLQNEELTGIYAYVGYENSVDGSWYIYRRTRSSNARLYASGASDYATNWSNRSALTYN